MVANTSLAVCLFILIILAESIFKGYKQGLFSIVVPVIAFVLALLFVRSGDNIFGDTVEKNIVEPSSGPIREYTDNVYNNMTGNGLEFLLPDSSQAKQMVQKEQELIRSLGKADDNQVSNVTKNVSIFAIVYTIIAVILKNLLMPFKHTLVIGTANRILGAIAGLGICLLKIWVVMDILCVLAAFIPPLKEWNEVLMTSSLYATLFALNPIIKL